MLKVQRPAPVFHGWAAVDGAVKEIDLSDYKNKYVVLFFYPLDWTCVCSTEVVAFSDAAANFKEIGCEVIGCSVDSVYCHLQFVKAEKSKGGLGGCNIPLIGDLSRDICKAYDVLIEEEGEDKGIALRGVFIIDAKGILRAAMTSDLQVGRNPAEILRMVQAFQHTDKNLDACPAAWTPGSRTLKADADASEFFAADRA